MLTAFTKDDQMLANELHHKVELPCAPVVATLITGEMGLPSFHSPVTTAWYGHAHLDELDVPFAMRCDPNGNWSMSVPMARIHDFYRVMEAIVPQTIEILEVPRGHRRAA